VRKLADDSGHTRSAIADALHRLILAGLVERSGERGRYRYALVKR
jgi:predicted transcriptional regulator